MEGKTQEAAAAAATGVSEWSVRNWQKGMLPSQTKESRWWRTREDPLAAELTQRFKAVLDHYEMDSTRIRSRKSHENGVAEKAHDVLKTALEQALLVRGSREFSSTDEYMAFVGEVTERLNARARVVERLAEERLHLLPLPAKRLPAYTTYWPVVRKWSTIRVGNRTYSVPSRLIGHEIEARLHPGVVEMATAAAIDRVIHHAVILEFDVSSKRAEDAAAAAENPGSEGQP